MTPAEDTASRASSRGWLRPCTVLGMWAGMLAGFVEVAHQAVRRTFFGRIIPEPEQAVWAVPALYLVLFLVLGLLLGLLGRRWRRPRAVSVAVFCFTVLAAWSQFLLHPSIGGVASFILSAGLAAQAARSAARHADALLRLSARTTPWLLGLIVLLAVGMPVAKSARERSAVAALPAPAAGAPNVLLVVLDTVRADHLKLYGYHRDTAPAIDSVAANGVVFDRVMATAPWTVPTHATMFTGHYTHDLQPEGWLGVLDGKHPTLAELFGAGGYATAGFVGNINYCCADRGFARGFAHYEDFYLTPAIVLSSSLGRELTGTEIEGHLVQYKRNSADTVTTQFLQWLGEQDGERPFFAFLNYFDAHALYLPPPPFDTRFGPPSEHLRSWRSRMQDWTDGQMQGFERAYDGCIALIDHHFARVLDALRRSGQLDRTVVIITADHGEHFGEYGLLSHANSLYRELLHVPLIISHPERIAARGRIEELVSLRDLGATVLDLAGVRPARPFPGQSLAPLWEGGATPPPALSPALSRVSPAGGGKPDWWPISKGTLNALTVGDLHYILNGDGSEELYDLSGARVGEGLPNLIETPEGARRAPELRRRLTGIIE